MDPVRLAFDVGPLHGHRTGVGAAVAELHAALADHPGVEVYPYLLSFRTRPQPPARRLPLPAALAHRAWARTDHPRVDRWLSPAQVIHGTNYVVPPSEHPRVVSVYDCWFLANPSLASPTVRRAGDVMRRSVRGGATVHVSSAATADAVGELLDATRVVVVPLAPLPMPAAPAERPPGASWAASLEKQPYVLSLGTIERRKNLPALVAAFAAASTELGDATLVVAGAPGDDAAALDEAVATLPTPLRQRVHRPGPVDDDTKAWLLQHAAALAYPSLDEGFGFPILEAQTVGIPVVATSAGSIPEVAGAGAELVALGATDELAAALVRVVGDDARRDALVAAGRANLARFSWSATADALVALYRQLRDRADVGAAR
jgi:glycosyltransferase involved in cell wall biosynthesis